MNESFADGWTALHYAADRVDDATHLAEQLVLTLLAAGADTEVTNSDGRTPLYLAIDAGNVPSIKALLEHGARVNVADTRGMTPLHLSAKRGLDIAVAWLLQLGGAPDAETHNTYKTPLHYACTGTFSAKGGDLHVVQLLLKAGADPSLCDGMMNETPLHVACRGGEAAIVMELLAAGCDYHHRNSDGDTAMKLALRYNHPHLAHCMRDFILAKQGRYWLVRLVALIAAGRAEIRTGTCESPSSHSSAASPRASNAAQRRPADGGRCQASGVNDVDDEGDGDIGNGGAAFQRAGAVRSHLLLQPELSPKSQAAAQARAQAHHQHVSYDLRAQAAGASACSPAHQHTRVHDDRRVDVHGRGSGPASSTTPQRSSTADGHSVAAIGNTDTDNSRSRGRARSASITSLLSTTGNRLLPSSIVKRIKAMRRRGGKSKGKQSATNTAAAAVSIARSSDAGVGNTARTVGSASTVSTSTLAAGSSMHTGVHASFDSDHSTSPASTIRQYTTGSNTSIGSSGSSGGKHHRSYYFSIGRLGSLSIGHNHLLENANGSSGGSSRGNRRSLVSIFGPALAAPSGTPAAGQLSSASASQQQDQEHRHPHPAVHPSFASLQSSLISTFRRGDGRPYIVLMYGDYSVGPRRGRAASLEGQSGGGGGQSTGDEDEQLQRMPHVHAARSGTRVVAAAAARPLQAARGNALDDIGDNDAADVGEDEDEPTNPAVAASHASGAARGASRATGRYRDANAAESDLPTYSPGPVAGLAAEPLAESPAPSSTFLHDDASRNASLAARSLQLQQPASVSSPTAAVSLQEVCAAIATLATSCPPQVVRHVALCLR